MANVVCMAFSSPNKAEEAKKAITRKDETPPTILEDLATWELASYMEVSNKPALINFLQNLPQAAKQTIYVGQDENGDYEVLGNRNEAIQWLEQR